MINVIALTALILSIVGLVIAVVSLAMWIGVKSSTHRIEWKSFDTDEAEGYLNTKDLNKQLKKHEEEVNDDFL